MQLVLASGNQGKLAELQHLLAPLGCDVISQADLNIASAPEPFDTFLENALTKARHAAAQSGLAAIADDSGLVVPSLGGAPGVKSARYAGDNATDTDNNRRLVEQLFANTQTDPEQRVPAHYYCALVYMRSATDPAPAVATGRWFGEIQPNAVGTQGFGYDPHFYVPAQGLTAAQLEPKVKNQLSHRGLATAQLIPLLRDLLQ